VKDPGTVSLQPPVVNQVDGQGKRRPPATDLDALYFRYGASLRDQSLRSRVGASGS